MSGKRKIYLDDLTAASGATVYDRWIPMELYNDNHDKKLVVSYRINLKVKFYTNTRGRQGGEAAKLYAYIIYGGNIVSKKLILDFSRDNLGVVGDKYFDEETINIEYTPDEISSYWSDEENLVIDIQFGDNDSDINYITNSSPDNRGIHVEHGYADRYINARFLFIDKADSVDNLEIINLKRVDEEYPFFDGNGISPSHYAPRVRDYYAIELKDFKFRGVLFFAPLVNDDDPEVQVDRIRIVINGLRAMNPSVGEVVGREYVPYIYIGSSQFENIPTSLPIAEFDTGYVASSQYGTTSIYYGTNASINGQGYNHLRQEYIYYHADSIKVVILPVGANEIDKEGGGETVSETLTELVQISDSWLLAAVAKASVTETASASDRVYATVYLPETVTETAAVSDGLLGGSSVSEDVTETGVLSDAESGRHISLYADSVRVSDGLNSRRVVREEAVASGRISGYLLGIRRDTSSVVASVSDAVLGRRLRREVVAETAAVADSDDVRQSSIFSIGDSARILDGYQDKLTARDIVGDDYLIAAYIGTETGDGQVWTANSDTWAMSRYAPFPFGRLAVVDGKLYVEAEDGVYVMDGREETINAALLTGKTDFGGTLVHPVNAYLEYAADGSAEMDVTTTQSGGEAKYTYRLPSENAKHLTNGRFTFGRGLRGRHFTFEMRMTGTYFNIEDMGIDYITTRRRV